MNQPMDLEPLENGRPRGLLPALRHLLVDDEGGSAAVEFMVLVPVYLLLLAGLFSISQLMLARQEVVAAVRYEAWSAPQGGRAEGDVKLAFFGSLPGAWSAEVEEEEVRTDLSRSSEGRGREIAEKVLDNQVPGRNGSTGAPLRLVKAHGTFTWQGLVPVAVPEITISCRAAVVLPNPVERPEFEDNQQGEHPMLGSVLNPPSEFTPTDSSDGYLSPLIDGTFDRDGANPGIWDPAARIRGDERSEHGVFRSNLR